MVSATTGLPPPFKAACKVVGKGQVTQEVLHCTPRDGVEVLAEVHGAKTPCAVQGRGVGEGSRIKLQGCDDAAFFS